MNSPEIYEILKSTEGIIGGIATMLGATFGLVKLGKRISEPKRSRIFLSGFTIVITLLQFYIFYIYYIPVNIEKPLNNEITTLKTQISELTPKDDVSENQIAMNSKLKDEIDDLRKDVENLNNANTGLQQKNDRFQIENTRIKNENNSLKNKNNRLKNQRNKVTFYWENTYYDITLNTSDQFMLSSLKQKLSSIGFKLKPPVILNVDENVLVYYSSDNKIKKKVKELVKYIKDEFKIDLKTKLSSDTKLKKCFKISIRSAKT